MKDYEENILPSLGFVPCVGPEYSRGVTEGTKLLILGESHYEDADKLPLSRKDHRNYTWDQFHEYQNEDYTEDTGRLGKQLNRILTGDPDPKKTEVSALWRKFAFANFVQEILPKGKRPSSEQWRDANGLFPDLLAALKPDAVLVLGKGTWNHINLGVSETPSGEMFPDSRPPRPLHRFGYAGGHAYATWLYHPSWNRDGHATGHDIFRWLLERSTL